MQLLFSIVRFVLYGLALVFWLAVYLVLWPYRQKAATKIRKILQINNNVEATITPEVSKHPNNPLLSPTELDWESEGTFNPAVLNVGGRVHLLYRAMGPDGMSRIGYASSPDGINFDERLPYPIYSPQGNFEIANESQVSTNRQKFDPNYRSGGGWCGCEDPRAVYIAEDRKIYMSYVAFAGWQSIRIGVTTIDVDDFLNKRWNWSRPVYLTESNVIAKSGAFFPERIKGQLMFNYRVFHNELDPPAPRTHFATINNVNARTPVTNTDKNPYIQPENDPKIRRWDSGKPSFGAPPIKTKHGWLVIQVAVAGRWEWPGSDMSCYRIGAILLDLEDPTKVLHRSLEAFIEPTEWYDHDWKPGVVYCCGAVVKDDELLIYYGGGDKHTALATANFDNFMNDLVTEMGTNNNQDINKNFDTMEVPVK